MNRYSFDFISSWNGKSDYRLYINGRADTRLTLEHETDVLAYADRSPVLRAELEAFNDWIESRRLEALAKYPEYVAESFMQRRTITTVAEESA